ncbi:hypothetical protein EB241_08470 [Erwinia psidii]|uniref:Uncharacterized protein n=1 Tax=Erwinia psidii TaxID=69224 RepID=A0A3N6SBI8_9GAMM|nr:hypothetical protein EB241_08470 [Erwinia psidii]
MSRQGSGNLPQMPDVNGSDDMKIFNVLYFKLVDYSDVHAYKNKMAAISASVPSQTEQENACHVSL